VSPSPAPLEEEPWGRVRIATASSLRCGEGGWETVKASTNVLEDSKCVICAPNRRWFR
jgi:hypothetical protein